MDREMKWARRVAPLFFGERQVFWLWLAFWGLFAVGQMIYFRVFPCERGSADGGYGLLLLVVCGIPIAWLFRPHKIMAGRHYKSGEPVRDKEGVGLLEHIRRRDERPEYVPRCRACHCWERQGIVVNRNHGLCMPHRTYMDGDTDASRCKEFDISEHVMAF